MSPTPQKGQGTQGKSTSRRQQLVKRQTHEDLTGSCINSCPHDCTDVVFPEVLRAVSRVSAMPHRTAEDLRARNYAISAHYAKLYLKGQTGRAFDLKFAAGAAFGSTIVGYAIDKAVSALSGRGLLVSQLGGRTMYTSESMPPLARPGIVVPLDENEIAAADWTYSYPNDPASWPFPRDNKNILDTSFSATAMANAALERLSLGNLAIFMDLYASMLFYQLHEERYGFVDKGMTNELMQCFDRFVRFINKNGQVHETYRISYGGSDHYGRGNVLRDAIYQIAQGRIRAGCLRIIEHEQHMVAEPLIYFRERERHPTMVTDKAFHDSMNSLSLKLFYGGIQARFEAEEGTARSPSLVMDYAGGPFEVLGNRLPWLKDVLTRFMDHEEGNYRTYLHGELQKISSWEHRRADYGRD